MAELRQRARRFSLPLPVRYRIATAADWLSGTTRNLSDSGILFTADQSLEVGMVLEMELAMEADGERWPSMIVAHAAVVRVLPESPQAVTAIAARFLDHEMLPRPLGPS
jgi:hypothetical protein